MPHMKPLELDQIEDADLQERLAHYERTRGFYPKQY